jgi:hypothetical protein
MSTSTEKNLRDALSGLLEMYLSGAASGDWGNWNPEDEAEVIAARKALNASTVVQVDDNSTVTERDKLLLRTMYAAMKSTGQDPHETDEQMITQCQIGDEVALAVLVGLRAVATMDSVYVGKAGAMPGTNGGFTMACFIAENVPAGTSLYLRG